MQRVPGIAAAAFGAAAVMLGAFGAHALRGRLDAAALQIWHTAVEYQFWHALALLAIASAAPHRSRLWSAVIVSFVFGILLFSGSLYLLALGAPHWLGFVTPFGGGALILGWLLLAAACCNATNA